VKSFDSLKVFDYSIDGALGKKEQVLETEQLPSALPPASTPVIYPYVAQFNSVIEQSTTMKESLHGQLAAVSFSNHADQIGLVNLTR